MNKPGRKIEAFTLLELLVTLTLTVLIVAMSYFSYSYIFEGFLKYRDINAVIEQHSRAQNNLNHLLRVSDRIIRKKDGIEFYLNENNRKIIKATDSYLLFVNNDNSGDTVKMKIFDVKTYWKGDSVLPDNGPVQKIKLDIDFSGTRHSLIFEKLYDSKKLIELDSLDKAVR